MFPWQLEQTMHTAPQKKKNISTDYVEKNNTFIHIQIISHHCGYMWYKQNKKMLTTAEVHYLPITGHHHYSPTYPPVGTNLQILGWVLISCYPVPLHPPALLNSLIPINFDVYSGFAYSGTVFPLYTFAICPKPNKDADVVKQAALWDSPNYPDFLRRPVTLIGKLHIYLSGTKGQWGLMLYGF